MPRTRRSSRFQKERSISTPRRITPSCDSRAKRKQPNREKVLPDRFQDFFEARMLAQRIKVGIMFDPGFIDVVCEWKEALEQIERVFPLAYSCIQTRGVK